jgi:hypothetical protein
VFANSGLNSTAAADQHVHKNRDFGKIVPPRFSRCSRALGNDGFWLEGPLLADIVEKVPSSS